MLQGFGLLVVGFFCIWGLLLFMFGLGWFGVFMGFFCCCFVVVVFSLDVISVLSSCLPSGIYGMSCCRDPCCQCSYFSIPVCVPMKFGARRRSSVSKTDGC